MYVQEAGIHQIQPFAIYEHQRIEFAMRKLKVVVCGIHYPVSMMGYFIRALERRDDVELITVGPFTGNQIPWGGGMVIDMKYVKTPTFPLSPQLIQAGKVSSQSLEVINELRDVDLWLEVDAGFYIDPKPTSGIIAHVATDPHVLNYDRQRQLANYFFCMQTPYMKAEAGDFYLPYAFDPTIHFPEPNTEKVYGACIIGLQYAHRNVLVNVLRAHGISVYQNLGVVYDDYRRVYNQSKIALSWSSLLDMPARVWEAFGMGIPLVTNRVPDLSTFFVEDDHYLGFSDASEAVTQVKKLLADPEMASHMADAAYRKAIASHTWDHRITQILETVKLR